MHKRNFKDFLTAYAEYARDGFCPDMFHWWIGASVLSGALERKVSLKDGKIHYFPNTYIMLVSHPADGKSTAIARGTTLLENLKKFNPEFRIISNQTTEAALVKVMKVINRYEVLPGVFLPHSSGYFYASEASASALQNVCGDFVATMTEFYDCPAVFRKTLASEQGTNEIENSCMSLLAGSTFEYLKNLINEKTVLGGFASRNIYVVNTDRKVREIKWGGEENENLEVRSKLLEDLIHINKLAGPMKPTPEWIAAYEKWFPEFDAYRKGLNSPRMESLLGRKPTNLVKLSMLLSISERDDLVITGEHFRKAHAMIEGVMKDVGLILSSAIIADKDSQQGLTQLILRSFAKVGEEMHISELKAKIMRNGNDVSRVEGTLKGLSESRWLKTRSDRNGELWVELLINPDGQL